MLPDFDADGSLPDGDWECTGEDFKRRFLNNNHRMEYLSIITNIFDFAASYGALSVLVGGSFITNTEKPRDFDCVVLFAHQSQIPPKIESLDIGGNSVDIFFASQDQPQLVGCFHKLLSTNRLGDKIGVVNIAMREKGKVAWDITWEIDKEVFEIVRRAYIQRHYVEKIPRKKTLITIHGIRTSADWNAEIILNASANGWTVAPFQYGYIDATVFLQRKHRRKILDQFRDFLVDVTKLYGAENVSIIAHSFGTYIAFNYILGFDQPPTRFDTLILCGAIVDETIDLDRFEGRVAHIVNEKAPNDEWVEWAKKANLWQDELFGYAGTRGFLNPTPRLSQSESLIFTHNNVIKRDVVSQRWMPLLEANVGAVYYEAGRKFLRDVKRSEDC